MIKTISISGLRSFGKQQTINFALPNHETRGSGLSIITGANNSGKTTIMEAIQSFNNTSSPSFSEGKRNINTQQKVKLILTDENDKIYLIETVKHGGSSTNRSEKLQHLIYSIPSRRGFASDFNQTNSTRDSYIQQDLSYKNQRPQNLSAFDKRIFEIEKHKEDFDKIIHKILGTSFNWTIEQRDSGLHYIKCIENEITHSSEGIGDGILSLFVICSALFDIRENDIVMIDEPELSLHPALQKRLFEVLLDYSKDHQIIISTHSPYFISFDAITNGSKLIRVVKEKQNSICYQLDDDNKNFLKGISTDIHNPHILGMEAKEIFFTEDKIILVEGQEDVVIFNKILKELNYNIQGSFFGWGVGGAEKMYHFLKLFHNLGYKYVVVILDGDKQKEAEQLRSEYKEYKILTLSTDDIRDKEEKTIKRKTGLTNSKGELKEEHKQETIELFDNINQYFQIKHPSNIPKIS